MVAIPDTKITKHPKAPPIAENEGRMLCDGSPVDVTGWITANQTVDMLGVSRMTLERWVRRGYIRPAKARRDANSMREIHVYNPVELAKLPRKHKGAIPDEAGELAARIYELLGDGRTNREIVILTRQTPQRVDEFRQTWLDDGGSHLVISPQVHKALVAVVGDFETVADLVMRVQRLAPASVEIDASEREGA
jgi:hypothetical protein